MAYPIWISLAFLLLLNKKPRFKRMFVYLIAIAYLIVSFVFLLYPPFQLSISYVLIAVLLGYLYYRYFIEKKSFFGDLKPWITVILSLFLASFILLTFYLANKQPIRDIINTAYPGSRSILSGKTQGGQNNITNSMATTFSASVLINLQDQNKSGLFYSNQSESAKIVLLNIFLLPIFLYTFMKKKKDQRKLVDYLLVSTSIIDIIFLIRIFTPFFNLPFKLLLFDRVPNERLAIGLMLLCVLQLALYGITDRLKYSKTTIFIYVLAVFSVCLDSSMIMYHLYPHFINITGIIIVNLVIALVVFLVLENRYFILGLGLFMAFELASSLFVNPLYNRSEPKALQVISTTIHDNYKNNKIWGVYDSIILENVPAVAGKHSISGVQVYPQFKLWKMIDSTKRSEQSYNRYAHVVFTATNPNGTTFYNPQGDVLNVTFSCQIAQKIPGFGYLLSNQIISNPTLLSCLRLDRTITFPYLSVYIYKYTQY